MTHSLTLSPALWFTFFVTAWMAVIAAAALWRAIDLFGRHSERRERHAAIARAEWAASHRSVR